MTIFTKGYPVVDCAREEHRGVGPLDHTLVVSGKRFELLEEYADRLDFDGIELLVDTEQ